MSLYLGCIVYALSRESDITKERIEKILKAGANVILTSKGIDDMSLKVIHLSFRINLITNNAPSN